MNGLFIVIPSLIEPLETGKFILPDHSKMSRHLPMNLKTCSNSCSGISFPFLSNFFFLTSTMKMKGSKKGIQMLRNVLFVCVAPVLGFVVERGRETLTEKETERDEICDLICSPGASLHSGL